MWRCPKEDNKEQHDGLPPLIGLTSRGIVTDYCPTHHRRHTASEAAPDDVLGIAHLQKLRIDEDIEEVSQDDEERCQPGVRQNAQPEDRKRQHHPRKDGSIAARDTRTHERPSASALHFLVDLIVHHIVEGVGSRSAHPAAEDGGKD